ncbi:L-type lectin-domain containing receptor kinase IV.4-like [Cryptomeria japonica]|uniref:L-type lectin-domain containing receptor kinase IV.4-like n=1 Tax=Cryptomeria japonica TaxID=3369 RepID=UPI0027DA2985|nr:L-type lectin-domain containing receptor kinase IV.4-like [Cryptomeria japonica]
MGKASNHLFVVEFSTLKNLEFHDINDNHVGVDLNDLRSVKSSPAGFWAGNNQFQDLNLKSGQNIQAWIDYDHLQNELRVTIAEAGSQRPETPLIFMKNMSLPKIVEEEMFQYKDLHIARKGFGEKQLLGCGGFSQVYKGVLPTNSLQVVVKRILRETDDGVKDFIAEISSLGRLQHRNLVQIRGFCRRQNHLFIVYDYMPNGSLNKMIFGNPKKVFKWGQRYKVLRDVAAGLMYRHEEWEQRVVHRDIKSSNILLDSEFNGKLGDFGLARLYEHNESSHTTRVVGTLGYIAPELIHTGKVSPATDVFSFGILMLEVACRRRPVDPSLQPAQGVLVDWVRELDDNGSLMDAADPNLGGQYVEAEMERVLKLGLLCSNPQPDGRPGTRQVLQRLEQEAPIANFDASFHLEMSNTWRSPKCYSHSADASISISVEGR